MDPIQLERDYQISQKFYKDFQNEIFIFLNEIIQTEEGNIDIDEIVERKEIKSLESIKKNLKDPQKYQNFKSIFDIKDIAGVRITCHCEDDIENLKTLLRGVLNLHYLNVSLKNSKEENADNPYNAWHFTFSKPIKINGEDRNLFCEIQIRTVLGNAWAIQNHKYLYKKIVPGESQELTIAVSEIMNGCEKLWSLVKNKSRQEEKTMAETKKHEQAVIRRDFERIESVNNWIDSNKTYALNGIQKLGIKTYMEVTVIPFKQSQKFSNEKIKDSAQISTTKTFGWPIGLFSFDRDEFTIKNDPNGIHVEISLNEPDFIDPKTNHISYDFWAIHESASFYLLKSLFEDLRKPNQIFFNTRIIRITEVFMYIEKLYLGMGFPKESIFELAIKHAGLEGRILSSSSPNRNLPRAFKAGEKEVQTSIQVSIEDIPKKLPDIVEKYTAPLFESFESFKLEKSVLEDIVNNYYIGRVV